MFVRIRVLSIAATVLAVLWTGCGYVGDPLPPALNIPTPVLDLSVTERGEKLIIQFSVSKMTTEGLALKGYGAVDLRLGSAGVQPFERARWEAGAQPLEVQVPAEAGAVRVELPVGNWVGREVAVSVRMANLKGRWSEWSEPFHLPIVEPVRAPSNLTAESAAAGVRLKWNGPARDGVRYRVFRRSGENGEYELRGEVEKSEWLDTNAAYGTSYEYQVQSLVAAGERVAGSELSGTVAITPVDHFPPPAPTGLQAVAGLDSIEITWDRGQDSGVASYDVYRRSEGEVERRVASGLTVPSYSDHDVAAGRRYRFTVTASDRLGNESERSTPVEQTAP